MTLHAFLALLFIGCSNRALAQAPQEPVAVSSAAAPAEAAAAPEPEEAPAPAYELKGDLPDIVAKGTIRFLVTSGHDYLQRVGDPKGPEIDLARAFAEKLGIKAVFIPVASRDELPTLLDAGKGDVIAASMAITPERSEKMAFTRALRFVKEQVVVKAGDDGLKSPSDLEGQTVTVRASSSYASVLKRLKTKDKKPKKIAVTIKPAGESEDTFDLIAKVARGQERITVADSDIVSAALAYEKGAKAAFDLTDKDPIAWGLRKDAASLKAALDAFIVEKAMTTRKGDRYLADLDDIKARKVLRVLTRNSATSFFLYRGEQLGFEYELAQAFAKSLKVRLEIVIPPSRDALFSYLKEGRGDLIAAGLAATPERRKDWAFSAPYTKVSQLLLVPVSDTTTQGLADLKGKKIAVRQSSSYYQTLKPLKDKYGFELQLVPEEMETEEILGKLGEGKYAASAADSNIVEVEMTYNDKIRSAGPIGELDDVAWAMRKESPKLKEEADAFIKSIYKGAFYNLTVKKYFKNPKQMREAASDDRSEKGGSLSPFDALVKKFATQFEMDWRLVTSQMYEESHFDPAAKSWVGALGLMQVMPKTGLELGFPDVVEPEHGINAGIMLVSRYSKALSGPKVKEKDRMRMAIAAYNCGIGHILDARRLAADMGLNPDKWFGNVEKALLELAKPEIAKKARYGYCRGSEPVAYVSRIQSRYEAYSKLVGLE